MRCPKCGKENEKNQIFCSQCGTWIMGEVYEEDPSIPSAPEEKTSKKQTRISYGLLLGVLPVLCLLIVATIILWPNGDPSATDPNLNATTSPHISPVITNSPTLPPTTDHVATMPPVQPEPAPHVYVYSENYLAPIEGLETMNFIYDDRVIETNIPMDENWEERYRGSMKGYSAAFLDENQTLYYISENSCNLVASKVLDFQMNAQGGIIVYLEVNGQLKLYSGSTGIRFDEIITYSGASSFAVSPNGQYCAYLDLSLNIYKNGELRHIVIEDPGSTLLSISNDGSTIYLRNTEDELVVVYADGTTQNWGKMQSQEPIYLSADHSQILFRGKEENFLCTGWELYPMPSGDLQPVKPQGSSYHENGNLITYPCDEMLDQTYALIPRQSHLEPTLPQVSQLYYVDRDGSSTLLEWEVYDFCLEQTGTYLYYTDAYAQLIQYDPRENTKQNIAPEGAIRFVLSPDGKYICYDTSTKVIVRRIDDPENILYEMRAKDPQLFITKGKVVYILTGTQLYGYRFTSYGMDFHYTPVQECWLSDNGVLYLTYPDSICRAKADGRLLTLWEFEPEVSVEMPELVMPIDEEVDCE